jgi:hypothetical protein
MKHKPLEFLSSLLAELNRNLFRHSSLNPEASYILHPFTEIESMTELTKVYVLTQENRVIAQYDTADEIFQVLTDHSLTGSFTKDYLVSYLEKFGQYTFKARGYEYSVKIDHPHWGFPVGVMLG